MNQSEPGKVSRASREFTLSFMALSDLATRPPDSPLAREYEILASRIGLVDRSSLTKLKLVGKDTVDLLQRLSTNNLQAFLPGSCIHTVLTTEKGRVIDLVTLYHLSNSELILVCHAPPEKVINWIQKFIIMEDVSVLDLTTTYSAFSLIGPGVGKLLSMIEVTSSLRDDKPLAIEAKVAGIQVIVGSAELISPSNVNLLVPIADAYTIWQKLVEDGSEIGLRPCGIDALEIHRIEHGFPVYGRELTEEVNPLEAGLERFVSFTKGCYIGQEVIARLDTYKKLQKRLVGLLLNDNAPMTNGARVSARGTDVGWVTSAAQSPHLNRTIGLAYVRSTWAIPATSVDVTTESGTHEAQVVQLPFEV
jgi:folate-binding protein YgfZ